MGICRSCFHSPTDDGASNERSPLHSPKTSALYQQAQAATAWSQRPTQGDVGGVTDALHSQEHRTVTYEGRPSSSSVKTVEPSHDGEDSDSTRCAAAPDSTRAALSLPAVNKANYHQLSIMLGIDAEDAKRIVDARHVVKGFGTLDALLAVSGITHDTRHKIEQKLCMPVACLEVHCLEHVAQEGSVSGVVQETQFGEGGESLLRVATWNLQQFTTEKAASRFLVGAVCDVIIDSR